MIYISFNFSWPIKISQKEIFYFDKPISKNKAFSVQIDYEKQMIASFGFSWVLHQCHSGPMLEFGLLGLSVILNLYDQRHWNYEKDRYEKYPDESMTDEEWNRYRPGEARPE